jgi:putative ABC transport system ATP-binding protein
MSRLATLRNVTKIYSRGNQRVEVLHGIDLDIERGEFLALMGPSGWEDHDAELVSGS